MTFLVIVAVFIIVQHWGSGQPVQKDEYWQNWAVKTNALFNGAEVIVLAQVLVPVVALFVFFALLSGITSLLVFLASIPLLLYCLGRGDYSENVKGYIEAHHRQDNEMAAEYAQHLGVDTTELSGWSELNKEVLRQAAYHGFERMFVAIFWFFILGPVGALLYRLAFLSSQYQDNSDETKLFAMRLVWLLEWPVVRALGCSFALTGNFVGCIQRVQDGLMSTDRSTTDELESMVHGALNVNSQEITQESITEKEVEALLPLLSRSLILWLCVMAVLSLL
jgi:AmpE protein